MAYSPTDLCFQNKTRMVRLATLVKNIAGASGNKTVSQLTTLVNNFPTKDLSNTSWRTVSESASEISECNLELKSQMESLATAIRNKTGIDNTSANKLTREQMIYLLEQWDDEDIKSWKTLYSDASKYEFEASSPIQIRVSTSQSEQGSPSDYMDFEYLIDEFPTDEIEVMLDGYTFTVKFEAYEYGYSSLWNEYGPHLYANVICKVAVPNNYTGYFRVGSGRFGLNSYLVYQAILYCSDGYTELIAQGEDHTDAAVPYYCAPSPLGSINGDPIAEVEGLYGEYCGPENGFVSEICLSLYSGSDRLNFTYGDYYGNASETLNIKLTPTGNSNTYNVFVSTPYWQSSMTSGTYDPATGTCTIYNLLIPFRDNYSNGHNLIYIPQVYLTLWDKNIHGMSGNSGEFPVLQMSIGSYIPAYYYWYGEQASSDLHLRASEVYYTSDIDNRTHFWDYAAGKEVLNFI